MRFLLLMGFILFVSACSNQSVGSTAGTPIPIESIPTINPTDTELALAQRNYNIYCAHCHGYGGEGQPGASFEQTVSLGYHTVPLHNADGHTWQHPDQLIFQTIKYGAYAPTNLYEMISYADLLSDDEIFAIIDYIRLWWTPEQRRQQARMTEQFTANNPSWAETNLSKEEQNP